uniref:ANF_receptor domain-containing protein n=1 Tax=Macrostomum lignano TaxID=282301 RepID=A0A1I8FGQ2_9PLAT
QIGLNLSPELSDRSIYPYYTRMPLLLTCLCVKPLVSIVTKFNWKKIGFLVQDYSAFKSQKDIRIFIAVRRSPLKQSDSGCWSLHQAAGERTDQVPVDSDGASGNHAATQFIMEAALIPSGAVAMEGSIVLDT